MKKKIHRILGIGLTLVLAISLSLGMAVPVAASPDTDEWEEGNAPFDFPSEGSDGDWFWSPALAEIGPMAQAINGDLYVAADDGSDWTLLMSDDGGRTWSATDYADDVDDQVRDIAVSSEDADVLYVATFANEVWRSEDAGDSWDEVGEASISSITGDITSIAVGYSSGTAYVYIGTTTWGGYAGEVWFLEDASFARVWIDLEVDDGGANTTLDIYSVNTSPFFDDDTEVDVLATDGGNYTAVLSNIGGSVGAWDEVAELEIDDTTSFESIWASDIVYVADFDDEYEMFVGVVEESFGGLGDVFRVVDGSAYDLSVDDDIVSLDIIGDLGYTSMVAGAIESTGPAQVYYTTDDGDSWDDADKVPSGNGSPVANLVVMADDFDESGIAWSATYADDEGAVSMTDDGGDAWNQISVIDTNIGWVTDVAMGSPGWMVTFSDNDGGDDFDAGETSSLWRNDGTNWERVWESGVFGDDMIDLVAVSPESDDVLYIAGSDEFPWSTQPIYRSTDNGQTWDDLVRDPDDISWSDAFLVLDDDTIIVGGENGEIHKTTRYGRRAWDTEDIGTPDIMSLVASPDVDTDDTLLLGTKNGEVWLSEDLGDDWDEVVGGDTLNNANTFVAFDPDFSSNNTIFAAAGGGIYVNEEALELDDSEWDALTDDGLVEASGIAVADDGTLYVLDYGTDDGMQRSVDPLGDAEFELVDTEIDALVQLTNMFLTSGSTVIWGIDITEAEVWSYEDTLAVPVRLRTPANNSTSGREGTVAFHWTQLDEAGSYQVEILYQGDLDPDDAWVIDTIDDADDGVVWDVASAYQGLKLRWRVRGMPDDPVMSKWSDEWVFTTALTEGQWNPFVGGVNESPANGASDVPLMPTFAWNAADWATGYEFVLADNSNFTSAIASETVTTTVYTSETELEYSSTYYWKVRAVSATSESEWGTGVFTTMDKAPAPPPPPPTQPQATLTVPPPIQAPPAIPPYLLWTIIGIGAALAIAVIVLIIRTRRTV